MEFECNGRTFFRRNFDNLVSDSPEIFKWCINLIQDNMEFRHSKSQFLPWSKKTKISELEDPLTRVILIYTEDYKPVGFASYQLTTEPDMQDVPIPCLYWYELQIVTEFRCFGLGSHLVKCIEEIALENSEKCQKIMLTAFKTLPRNKLYRSPINFYTRHGFEADPISPSQCLKARDASIYDYEIMSKPLYKIKNVY